MSPQEKVGIVAYVIVIMLLVMAPDADAADLYIGGNWLHISQIDKGCPQDCDTPESTVDHFGVHLEGRWYPKEKHELSLGASFGINANPWGCGGSECWDDAGGIGSMFYARYNYKIGSF